MKVESEQEIGPTILNMKLYSKCIQEHIQWFQLADEQIFTQRHANFIFLLVLNFLFDGSASHLFYQFCQAQ